VRTVENIIFRLMIPMPPGSIEGCEIIIRKSDQPSKNPKGVFDIMSVNFSTKPGYYEEKPFSNL